jgi:hypothetical protein
MDAISPAEMPRRDACRMTDSRRSDFDRHRQLATHFGRLPAEIAGPKAVMELGARPGAWHCQTRLLTCELQRQRRLLRQRSAVTWSHAVRFDRNQEVRSQQLI